MISPFVSSSAISFSLGSFCRTNWSQLRRVHPGVNQLLEGRAGVDRFVLAGIADEQQAIGRSEPFQDVSNLLGAGEARLVDLEQPLRVRLVRRLAGISAGC